MKTEGPLPPKAKKVPHKMEKHGDVRVDDYFWLKDRENPDVINYLNAENAYVEQMLAPEKELIDKLFLEMKSRMKESDSSAKFADGPYRYWSEVVAGEQYFTVHREPKSTGKKPAVGEKILDVNQLATGYNYYQIGQWEVSPDHQLLAYSVDQVGRRKYAIIVVDLKTKKNRKHFVAESTGNFVWGEDNQTLYWTKQHPETLRSDTVYETNIETGVTKKIYFEKDETFSVSVGKSESNRFLFIASSSTLSSEVRFLDQKKGDGKWNVFLPREPKHEYTIEDSGHGFLVFTNWQAKNFRVAMADYAADSKKDKWQEVIPHRESTLVEEILPFKNFIAIREREQGLSQIRILRKGEKFNVKETGELLRFPDAAYVVSFGANAEFDANTLRINYQSMVKPNSVYDYDLASKKLSLIKQSEVPNAKLENYVSERILVPARDGVKIPVSLVYHKDYKKDGTHPLLLYGYGSYGMSMDVSFSASRLSLLDRGFAFAIAHIRGGEELGRSWYEDGKLLKKKNTFTDFIDCAEYIGREKIAHPRRISAMGGSAGGLLMGAVTNMRPDVWKSIIASVPFVDVVTTMLDDSIPLTTGEYDEWGNPNQKEYYDYMKSYSPYDNVKAQNYPHLFVTTGLHDSQVQYWEPAKWVAKLRELKTDHNLLLFKTTMDQGHSGASGRYDFLKEIALDYAFLLKVEGIK